MNRLAALTTGRTFLPLFLIYPIFAIGFLSAYPSDSEAKHNQKQKATADSRLGRRYDGDPFTNDSRSDNFNLRGRRNKHDRWRHFGRFNSQGYQGKRVPQGYQGKRVPQGYQGKRVRQGYQVDGHSRRRDARLRWRRSSPPPKWNPYARRSSTVWKRTPSAKTRTKSLWHTPSTFKAETEPNLNSSYITPNFGSTPTTTYSNPYDSYGNTFGTSKKDSSKKSPKTPAWPNYSLIAPGWSAND